MIISICAPNVGIPNFIKYTLQDVKEQIGPNTLITGKFNGPTLLHRQIIQTKKINNSTSELNCTIDQKDLTGIYGVFYSATAEYPFCSVILGTFSKIDHM
jgi:hypothetical protein